MKAFDLSRWRFPDISPSRILAVFLKETVQMRRDRMTFAIMTILPVMQLILFGFAINNDPRHLPAVVELREDGPLTRSFLASLRASSFVDIIAMTTRDADSDRMLRSGEANFIIVIPEGFERDLVRGARPQILIAADASDPVASGNVISSIERVVETAFAPNFEGPLAFLARPPPPYEIVVHRRFNPAGVTAMHIVPALLGVILTMTMTMVTSIALTRESERGTMEFLLATPVRSIEVMLGKTTPYIMVGAIQTVIVMASSALIFHVPFSGSPIAFLAAITIYIFANLMQGYLISTVARTQMQAMQLTFLVFLPSVLLSGFAFPFAAMPQWAKDIGEALPITPFLRIVREVLLKGAGLTDISGDLGALALITAILAALALVRFRRTLD